MSGNYRRSATLFVILVRSLSALAIGCTLGRLEIEGRGSCIDFQEIQEHLGLAIASNNESAEGSEPGHHHRHNR
jgi:hypothetical protein